MFQTLITAINDNGVLVSFICSGLAFFISLASLFYTRKNFNAATVPRLQLALKSTGNTIDSLILPGRDHRIFHYRVQLTLKNLSNNNAIEECSCVIKIAHPNKKWRFLPWRKWFIFEQVESKIVRGMESETVGTHGSIESFLKSNMPDLIQSIEIQQPHPTTKRPQHFLSLTNSEPLDIKLEVSYQPAISGVGRQNMSRQYQLVPRPLTWNDLPKPVYEWEFREKKSK